MRRYEEKAKFAKAENTAAMEEWKKTDRFKDYQNAKASHNKKKADKKAKDAVMAAGMPKKPLPLYYI